MPSVGLGHGELRVVGDDADVGAERELEAAADRVALHGGDADQIGPRGPVEGLLPLARSRAVASACGQLRQRQDAVGGAGANSARSSPAENARPAPRSTTTRTSPGELAADPGQLGPHGRALALSRRGGRG